jgi:signal transduction histidine kinase
MPRRSGRSLRARLTLLYAGFFLAAGAILLVLADLPLLTVRRTVQAPGTGARAHVAGGASVNLQTSTNLGQLAVYSGIALAVMAVLCLPLGYLLADRVLRPLRAITASARIISAGNLHERLGLDAPFDEFTQLGEALDELFGRLETAFEAQRHFVANASHELRTPLTAQRTLLQVALADPAADAETLRTTGEQLLDLGAHQERLIEALLTLAGSERGLEQHDRFDLADIAEQVLLTRRQDAERRAVRIDATLTAAPIAGDPSLVRSLVANLVDNALRYNVPEGKVEISTATTGGRPSLTVGNTGPVIPPGQIEALFQPFQRLGGQRIRHSDGHGLGLAIVRAIAIAHGAALTTRARPEGGLDIQVTFPAPCMQPGTRTTPDTRVSAPRATGLETPPDNERGR